MIERPLAFPCDVTLANRLCKAAMIEGLTLHRTRDGAEVRMNQSTPAQR